jgi:uncharacterized protein
MQRRAAREQSNRVAAASGATGFILICLRLGPHRGRPPLIRFGQHCPTLYSAHVLLGMGTLGEMGRLEQGTVRDLIGSTAVFLLAGIPFSALWSPRFCQGPIEALFCHWVSSWSLALSGS